MTTFRTRQEIFDLAWNGLKAQGFERSMSKDENCAYRGVDGRRCAIGFCIEDENYDEELIEGLSAENEDVRTAAMIDPDDEEFAEKLQGAHDEGMYPELMKDRLRAVAYEFNLTVPA